MLKKVWTPILVEEHILARVGREPLNSYYYATHYPRVYAAAERLFGSWREAITSCGLDYNEGYEYSGLWIGTKGDASKDPAHPELYGQYKFIIDGRFFNLVSKDARSQGMSLRCVRE